MKASRSHRWSGLPVFFSTVRSMLIPFRSRPNSFADLLGERRRSRRVYLYLEVRKMEIGCGARVRDFDGRRYFYFWHYERDDGRSTRREDYVGRVDSERARSELLRRMAAYHRRAEQEFARRRARIEGLIAAHTST